MTHLDRSTVERFEHEWRSRGLRVFSVVTIVTLAAYSVVNFIEGLNLGGLATGIGVPLVAWTWVLSRRDPMPRWASVPLTVYLLTMLGTLLAAEHADSAPVMFLAAGPAIAILGFGAVWGLAFSAILLAMVFATFSFNDHLLPPAYENRFIVAFVFTMVVAYIYEYMRKRAVQELAQAADRIQTLESLLPMCAWCGKVDMEDGATGERWVPVERYLQDHDQQVTHGLCPDCYENEMARVDRELP